jgi:4-amino-4-deoxy-L-arabinose transferase-like glycosyltransferase
MIKQRAVLVLLLIAFIALQLPRMQYSDTDENLYYYLGSQLNSGLMPYRDFFYADPPLQAIAASLLYAVFGFNLIAFKLITVIIVLASAILLFIIAARILKNGWYALLACFIYLSSFHIFHNAVFFLGYELVTLLILLGIFFYTGNRPMLCGIFMGLALLTKLYSLPIVIAFLLWLIMTRQKLRSFLYGISLAFIIPFLLLLLIFQRDFFLPVIVYHFLKPALVVSSATKLFYILLLNPLVFIGLLLLFRRPRQSSLLFAFLLMISFQVIAVLLWRAFFSSYLLIIFPFLAILTAYLVHILPIKRYKLPALFIILVLSLSYTAYRIIDTRHTLILQAEPMLSIIENGPPGSLFGYTGVTPLFALLSNRPTYNNMVDMNIALFRTGILNPDIFFADMRVHPPAFIIMKSTSPFFEIPTFLALLESHCNVVSSQPHQGKLLYLYQCI